MPQNAVQALRRRGVGLTEVHARRRDRGTPPLCGLFFLMRRRPPIYTLFPYTTLFRSGDRLLLGVYSGTVMQIPDFAISPPAAITVPSTTVTPVNGPNFTVSRNDAFNS